MNLGGGAFSGLGLLGTGPFGDTFHQSGPFGDSLLGLLGTLFLSFFKDQPNTCH